MKCLNLLLYAIAWRFAWHFVAVLCFLGVSHWYRLLSPSAVCQLGSPAASGTAIIHQDWDTTTSSGFSSTTSSPRRCITLPYCSNFPIPLSRGTSTMVTPVLKHLPTVTPSRSARIALRCSSPCTSNRIQAPWLTMRMCLADVSTTVAFHHSIARRVTASGLSGWRVIFASPSAERSPWKLPHTRPCKSPMCYSVRRSSSVKN